MRTLRNNNWLNEREIKAERTKRRGRPMKVYKLTVPIDKIIQHYEELENGESARTMLAIKGLKELAAT
jgi:predicted transcriptional regulator